MKLPQNVKNIKVAITDLDGVLRGKYINKQKFESASKSGLQFCDVVFGWDCKDDLYEQDSFSGWKNAFKDITATLDMDTMRNLPTEDGNSVIVLGDFDGSHGQQVCPRSLLKRVLSKADDMGYGISASAEFEFFVFEETPHSVREKNYTNLKNMTPDMFGYSVIRNSTHSDFYHQLMNMCTDMDMEIEGLHTETGAGVLEAALKHGNALHMADKATLFKTFSKVLAQKQGLMATFMAKWSHEFPGQSGHLHMSVNDKDGNSSFFDKNKTDTISDTMRHFIGGQQKLMPELLAMVASTVNSYTRLIPGFWAPTDATWGVDNRTCAIRAIPGSKKSQRVEYRVGAADINPYLALSVAIGSGMWGIENKIEPLKPVDGNAYAMDHPAKIALPTTLLEAAEKFEKSKPAKEMFGDEFVKHYAYTRKWEFECERRAITDWQLKRYFEII